MIDIRTPKYQWGQKVLADVDLYNDGTFPEKGLNALLIRCGASGEIVQVGSHEESHVPVYLVEFLGGLVVGCFEEEIIPA